MSNEHGKLRTVREGCNSQSVLLNEQEEDIKIYYLLLPHKVKNSYITSLIQVLILRPTIICSLLEIVRFNIL